MALLIFDIDGTLLDTRRVTVPAIRRTFSRFNLPQPEEADICGFFGRSVAEYEAWLAAQCPAGMMDDIVAETNACELRMIGEEGRLYPGVRLVLETFRQDGHTLAICSNGPEDYVQEFLDAHDLRAFFEMVQARGARLDDKTVLVREILDTLPQRPAFVIGDRRDDIEAAHANGARAIGAAYGFAGPDELAAADGVVSSPAHIPAAVEAILRTM